MDVRVGASRRLRAHELVLVNCGAGEDSWESLGQQGDQTNQPYRKSILKFSERADAKAEATVLWSPDAKSWLIWERPWCWERLRTRGEGGNRGWDGWMALLTQWTGVWTNSGDSEGQGSLVCGSPWSHKESDMTYWLNNSNMLFFFPFQFLVIVNIATLSICLKVLCKYWVSISLE